MFGLCSSNALKWNVHFRCAGISSEYLGQGLISRSSGQGQGQRNKKARVCESCSRVDCLRLKCNLVNFEFEYDADKRFDEAFNARIFTVVETSLERRDQRSLYTVLC